MFRRSRLRPLLTMVLWPAFAGCGDAPQRVATPPTCDVTGTAALLHSKIDDEDGDGFILDEHYPQIDDEDDDIADHTWIQGPGGLYHLFFQNEGKSGGGNALEHYVSADLQHLQYVGVALAPRPGQWDSHGLWAPHVFPAAGRYYLFYTGVDGPANSPTTHQRIGVAVSQDLTAWTRLPVNECTDAPGDGCVYECIASWTTAGGPPGSFNAQCRDPFVLWDDAAQRWMMFATTKSVHGYAVVAAAYSADLVHWTSAGYVDATRRLAGGIGAQQTGGQAENPLVITRNGAHVLLFTDWQDPEDDWTASAPRTIVQWAASATLDADSTGSPNWVYRGNTPDPGVNAFEVLSVSPGLDLVSQSISNPDCPDHELHRRELRLKRIVWDPAGAFRFEGWPGVQACAPASPVATIRLEAP